MSQQEGEIVMSQILDSYLIDHQYEKVRQFNDEPNLFDFEGHTKDMITQFRQKQKLMKELAEKADQEKAAVSLGPQKHSRPGMPLPGSSNHFILDEINQNIKRSGK